MVGKGGKIMPIYLKEDVLGIIKDGKVLCADCYNDDMIDSNTEFIVEENLQDRYYICDESGKML